MTAYGDGMPELERSRGEPCEWTCAQGRAHIAMRAAPHIAATSAAVGESAPARRAAGTWAGRVRRPRLDRLRHSHRRALPNPPDCHPPHKRQTAKPRLHPAHNPAAPHARIRVRDVEPVRPPGKFDHQALECRAQGSYRPVRAAEKHCGAAQLRATDIHQPDIRAHTCIRNLYIIIVISSTDNRITSLTL